MITANRGGVTHERIGAVETIAISNGWGIVSGLAHDSRIALDAVAEIVADRTSKMRDKVYPALELRRADGSEICRIVGFEGLDPFNEAVDVFGTGRPIEPQQPEAPGERPEIAPTDAALVRLEAARGAGAPTALAFRVPGFAQRWSGIVAEVRPAMGFVNILTADFHLHIRAGAIAGWRAEDGQALDAAGEAIGLELSAAF
jgi:putative heme degradation protein